MIKYSIFTDGSVNQETKTGAGCFLILTDNELLNFDPDYFRRKIERTLFQNTSSTKLEIQTILFALSEIEKNTDLASCKLDIYTDSQNIISLPSRKQKLISRDYRTGNGERELKNAELYQRFLAILDKTDFRIIKVKGHKKKNEKDEIDLIFTLVDRESRRASREI